MRILEIEYADIVKSESYSNAEEMKTIMQQLGGCFSNIRTVYALAVTEKDNRELAYYMKIKTEAVKSGDKFVDTAAKQEARAYVSEYRRIRNVLEGYKDSAEKNISILQSCLKDERKEYNNPQQGD